MNKTIEATGKNTDEAIENALNELNVSRKNVDVEVLEKGSKGLFGIIGSKLARVRITVKNDYEYEARSFLKNVLNSMGIKSEIEIVDENGELKINISGKNMGILIGHRGETLDSLQYLTSLVINKNNTDGEYKRVVIDTENYRHKREETLIKLANRLAIKVRTTNTRVVLEPMNPYERRIIHSALQNSPYVFTHSEGEEPYRKVIIELKK
ncbi:MAG TPA: protein jag [Clostridiaceae bacterium]|nr:protein jag [Clostridiaceae bacterium]